MRFSNEFQDSFSHEALVGLQDAELKLLENMKKFVLLRAKCDRDYATALSMVCTQAQKLDQSKELEGSFIARAWFAIYQEMKISSNIIRRNAETLTSSTVEALNSLISEKQASKRIFTEEHDALNRVLVKMRNSVDSMKIEYEKLFEQWKDAKTKYEEQHIKAKGVRKVEGAKERYLKVGKKMHVLHNDFILTLCEASEYEKHFRTALLPGLLSYQQTAMEDSVETWKDILQEFCEVIDPTSVEYQAVYSRISKSIEVIDSVDEYNDFIQKNRSDPLSPIDFACDTSLLRNDAEPLLPNELVTNEFTTEVLLEKKKEYETKLRKCETEILKKQEDIQHYKLDNKLSQSGKEDLSLSKVKKKAVDILVKDLCNLQCTENILKHQLNLVSSALLPQSNSDHAASKETDKSNSNEIEGNNPKDGNETNTPEVDDVFIENSLNAQVEELNLTPSKKSKFFAEKLTQPFFTLKRKREIEDSTYQNEDWFHGVLPREEVVRLLVNDGDYLVRETVQNGEQQLALSVRSKGYKHFLIHMSSDKKWKFEGPSFSTIQELIMHYHQSAQPVTVRSGAILRRPIPREQWELNNEDVDLIEKIGFGNFGDVYRARLANYPEEVAVKTCHIHLPDAEKRKLLKEGRIFMEYNHRNIIKFIGICVQKLPHMIVMELVPGGSLQKYLKKHAESLKKEQLLSFCVDAASGMEYLESKNCIHRDLAARNCLVGLNNNVKISDFGMSRECLEYVVKNKVEKVPVKWTAPEALNYGIYTSSCDVWSYGILMWEIYSLGRMPYMGLSGTTALGLIEKGYRLPAPDNTPASIYQIMSKCWEYDPQRRPHFSEIIFSLRVVGSADQREDIVEL